jgi:hypothetical protein
MTGKYSHLIAFLEEQIRIKEREKMSWISLENIEILEISSHIRNLKELLKLVIDKQSESEINHNIQVLKSLPGAFNGE